MSFALPTLALLIDVFFRVSLTPAVSFAPVDLVANVSVKEGRSVRTELDCTNGYYSSSSWDWDNKPHRMVFKIRSGATCTLSVVVVDAMGKVIGFRTVNATVVGRE